MKNRILGSFLGLVALAGAVAVAAPLVSAAATGPVVNCTLSASPTQIQKGIPTQVTLHYTDSGANWLLWEGEGGGGVSVYGTFGDRKVTISEAKTFMLIAYDTVSGNAHVCVASVSSRSNRQPD